MDTDTLGAWFSRFVVTHPDWVTRYRMEHQAFKAAQLCDQHGWPCAAQQLRAWARTEHQLRKNSWQQWHSHQALAQEVACSTGETRVG